MSSRLADDKNDWKLFCRIIPIALRVAKFWTAKTPEADEARWRNEKGGQDQYHAIIHVELESINDSIQTLLGNEDISVPKTLLEPVLELLEVKCTIIKKRDKIRLKGHWQAYWENPLARYKHIEKLLGEREIAQWSPLQLCDRMKLTEKRDDQRKETLKRMTACAGALAGLASDVGLTSNGTGELWAVQNWNRVRRLYSGRRRRMMARLHHILTEHWVCECKDEHADVYLLVDPIGRPWAHKNLLKNPERTAESQLDGQFALWFHVKAKASEDFQWQQSDVLVYQDEWNSGTGHDCVNVLETEKSQVKKQKFVERSTTTAEPWDMPSTGICTVIQSISRLSPRSLHLLVTDNTLKHWTPGEAIFESKRQQFRPLKDIFVSQAHSNSARQRAGVRYVLMFLLASAFLQIGNSPWLNYWTKDHVYFLLTSSGFATCISEPFLMARLGGHTNDERVSSHMRRHPYPSILALGILLLQIWHETSIEDERTLDNPNRNSAGLYDIDADITVAEAMLQRCKGDSAEDFIDVIKACITPYHFNPGKSLDDDDFRQTIYTQIVGPLEYIIRTAHRVEIDDKKELRLFLESARPIRSGYLSVDSTPHDEFDKNDIIYAQQDNNADSPASASDSKDKLLTDEWMRTLQETMHKLLSISEGLNQPVFANRLLPSASGSRPVRIAILDTGISLANSALWLYRRRIMNFKDFIEPDTKENEWKDDDGHGTHAAVILLKVAPHMELYIARVFSGREDELITTGDPKETNRQIGLAIRHAVDKWEVDIISMSFGFIHGPPIINQAIEHASSKKVIMFAATGNSGGNSDWLYPARSPHVIGINATDGLGNKASFTATHRLNTDNFALPGIGVESSWPPELKEGLKMRASGTSCATPIAAGIAANMLEIAGLYLHRTNFANFDDQIEVAEYNWQKLRSMQGMRVAFHLMAPKPQRDNYDYIRPSSFLCPPEGHTIDNAMAILYRELQIRI